MGIEVEELDRANVGYLFYWLEITFLAVALLIPTMVWVFTHDGNLFSRSGSLVVFFSVLSEFTLLNKANVKHLRNAIRVHEGQRPMSFSRAANGIGYASLAVALAGTLLWGFGDMLCKG